MCVNKSRFVLKKSHSSLFLVYTLTYYDKKNSSQGCILGTVHLFVTRGNKSKLPKWCASMQEFSLGARNSYQKALFN